MKIKRLNHLFMLLFVALLGGVLLQGCQKEEIKSSDIQRPISQNVMGLSVPINNVDQQLVFLSKLIASAQKHPAFLNFMHFKALSNWGKIGSIVYLESKDEIVENGKRFAQILQEESVLIGEPHDLTYFDSTLVVTIPNLAIEVYLGKNNRGEDVEGYDAWVYDTPLKVVPDTEEFNMLDQEHMETCYDKDLNESSVSNYIEPNDAMFIVGRSWNLLFIGSDQLEQNQISKILDGNEPCDEFNVVLHSGNFQQFILPANSPLRSEVITTTEVIRDLYFAYCGPDDPDGGGSGGPGGGNEGGGSGGGGECDRDGNEDLDENIFNLKIDHSNLKTFCKWGTWWKNCHLEFICILPVQPENSNDAFTIIDKGITQLRRKMKKGKIFEPSIKNDIFRWDYQSGSMGKICKYSFIGIHNPGKDDVKTEWGFGFSNKVKFKDPLTGSEHLVSRDFKFKRKFKDIDVNLNSSFVYYCDEMPTPSDNPYSTGDLEFWLEQH